MSQDLKSNGEQDLEHLGAGEGDKLFMELWRQQMLRRVHCVAQKIGRRVKRLERADQIDGITQEQRREQGEAPV